MFLFREFAWYLLETDVLDYNNHWTPYYQHCSPCIANFSSIVKIDSSQFPREEEYLLKRTGLYDLVKPDRRNVGVYLKIYLPSCFYLLTGTLWF